MRGGGPGRASQSFSCARKKIDWRAVGVGDPSVEGQHGQKLFRVCDLVQQGIRNEIVNRQRIRIARMARAEVPAWLDRSAPRAGLEMHFRVGCEEFGGEPDDLVTRRGDLQMIQNFGGQEFINENPAVLRVILKLDDVEVAVVGFQQMGLRAAPHFADEPARVYGHTY